jgi:hypothetical protein
LRAGCSGLASARRRPFLTTHALSIIGLEKLYRTSDMIERERHEKLVRNFIK